MTRVLLVVLALAAVAAVALVGAVFGGGAGLAWLSLLASALGVALLVYDRSRRKPARKTPQGAEPGEERSNAADSADPDAGVVVIDERPRYHVATCEWVGDSDTIKLSLREARELGFTPCARCAPNATIAAEKPRGES